MKFKLLGPIQAQPDGSGQDLLAGLRPQHRLLLAILLLNKGNRVGMARLTELMWDDTPPYGNPQGDLNGLASDLRRTLSEQPGTERIPRGNDGYRIVAEDGEVDALRFLDLAGRVKAQAGRDDDEAVRLGRQALREWGPRTQGLRGPQALAGLRGRWAEDRREHLGSEHRNVLIRVLDAELRRGNHEVLATELIELEVDGIDRFDEDFARIYMMACQQVGRHAEAGDFYQRFAHAAQRNSRRVSGELSGLATRISNRDPFAHISDTITGKTTTLRRGELAMIRQGPSAEGEPSHEEGQHEANETPIDTEAEEAEKASSARPQEQGLIQNFGVVFAPYGKFGHNR